MGGAGTSPPPRRPAATRGAVGARGAYVTCQVSIQVCFEIYSRFETQMFVFQWGGARPDLRIARSVDGRCDVCVRERAERARGVFDSRSVPRARGEGETPRWVLIRVLVK